MEVKQLSLWDAPKQRQLDEIKLTQFQNDIIRRGLVNFVNGGGYPHRNGNPYAKMAKMGLLKLNYATTTWSEYELTVLGREYAISQGWVPAAAYAENYLNMPGEWLNGEVRRRLSIGRGIDFSSDVNAALSLFGGITVAVEYHISSMIVNLTATVRTDDPNIFFFGIAPIRDDMNRATARAITIAWLYWEETTQR